MKKIDQLSIAGLLLIINFSVHAATITAFAEVIVDGMTDTTAPAAQTSGAVGADAFAINGASIIQEATFAGARADVSGVLTIEAQGHGRAALSVPNWDVSSVATWSEMFTNSTSTDQTWIFDYRIIGGELSLIEFGDPNISARYDLDISIDSVSLISSSVVLTPDNVVETGASLGGVYTTTTISNPPEYSTASFSWGEITDSVNFIVPAFSTSILSYSLAGRAEGTDVVFATPPCDGQPVLGDHTCRSRVKAGGFSSDSVIVGIAQSTVPVPAAAWLFGSGLLGLVGVARRKKS